MVALTSFLRHGGGSEITAHTWPRVEPESGPAPYAELLSSAMQGPQRQRAWVAVAGRTVAGLAIARPRAGGLAWDIEHLHVAPEADELATELAEDVTANAGARGGRRVFMEAADETSADDALRPIGFSRFSERALYLLQPGFTAQHTDLFEARPRLSADAQPLFQLYNAAVPSGVRAAEAMTHEEWQGLYVGRRQWRPSFTGSRQQYVWELGASLVGWMEVTYGHKSQYVDLLVHPRFDDASDRLLRYALLQVSPKAAVYATARDYQPALASALARAGFRCVAQHELYAKLLAARVREPRLVPANVVGS
jgi:hypothetical protein